VLEERLAAGKRVAGEVGLTVPGDEEGEVAAPAGSSRHDVLRWPATRITTAVRTKSPKTRSPIPVTLSRTECTSWSHFLSPRTIGIGPD
jgi:hypothetical protein